MPRLLRSGIVGVALKSPEMENVNASVNEISVSDGCDAVKNDEVEINEGAMRHIEGLLEKIMGSMKNHELRLAERFTESETRLLERIDSLELKIAEKDELINDLRQSNVDLEKRMSQMESQVAIVRAANKNLIIDQDDLQQYGRRTNIRLEGLEYEERETHCQLKAKVEDALKSVGVDMKDGLLERFHRSGAPYVYNGKRVAQTIIRLRYWEQRVQAQQGKKVARENNLPVMIRNDLTKRRQFLLKRATDLLPKRKGTFAFANINSNLVVRDGELLHSFNTEQELDDILRHI